MALRKQQDPILVLRQDPRRASRSMALVFAFARTLALALALAVLLLPLDAQLLGGPH